jgi:hypothetical protein
MKLIHGNVKSSDRLFAFRMLAGILYCINGVLISAGERVLRQYTICTAEIMASKINGLTIKMKLISQKRLSNEPQSTHLQLKVLPISLSKM